MTTLADQRPAHDCNPPLSNGRAARPVRGYASGKEDYLGRLRKIEGQVRGLQRMIDEDRRPDIVTPLSWGRRL